MKRALVTGATGCLGRHLAVRLAEDGWDVTGLGRQQATGDALVAAGVRFHKGDIRDQQIVDEVCTGQEVIFHCAALSSPWGKYRDFFSSNVQGTRNLINAALRSQVQRFVHVSTPSLYFNFMPRYEVHEHDPLPTRPANHYAATKYLAEQIIMDAHLQGLPSIMIRPRAIFGPYDQTLFPRIVAANNKRGVPMIDGGQALIDLTCVDNVVDALLLCQSAPADALGRAYNISNGDPRPFAELVSRLFDMLDMPLRHLHIPYKAAYGVAALLEGVHRFVPALGEPSLTRYTVGSLSVPQTLCIRDAKEQLGYIPRVSIETGLQQFADWWRDTSC
ncbi:NAD(P)-dependent oxidoreductase [Paenibacillus barcinonensis]|uniref:NAD(P)-dependent oxidoreductase n=1 Tax=Paenibacillus barcinonensis TaxID=198119 RepID=A0A2V4VN84_PAEBA|nr:NAD(P)-dependent oxidoreductase [Paenibacillus barcinonensis]PYE47754.1 nucleoside-diphosphate-sugar epimerase [Paenibacillus barcinonensis]QKS59127.1 NAD(P)-dependent oxidoreductase [Paenibacillus barcinonensis]